MTFHVEIATDNAAFQEPDELPRLLRVVASKVEHGSDAGAIVDVNGNRVGTFWTEES